MNEYDKIPKRMREPIARWIQKGIWSGGDFLHCIFNNDLVRASLNADEENRKLLPIYAELLWHEVPARAWKSKLLEPDEDYLDDWGGEPSWQPPWNKDNTSKSSEVIK